MKTIFITAYNPFIARNILSSDVLGLIKKRPDIGVVVFVPTIKKGFFQDNYGDSNVIIEGLDLDPIIRSRKSKFWYRLAFLLQNTQYVKDQRLERLHKNKGFLGYLNYFWVNFIASVLSKVNFGRYVYRKLDFYFSPKDILDNLIVKYNPSLFFSTDIFSEYDTLLLRSAKVKKIKLLGMVRSWDNTTTKGILRVIPDRIITNSLTTKRELNLLHGYPLSKVSVAGLPQFDKWIDGPTVSREEFFRRIGADPQKKLVFFGPGGSVLSETDWQIAQILADALKEGKLTKDVQFFVSNHPHHPADFSKLKDKSNFIFETIGQRFKKDDYKYAEFSREEHDYWRNIVYYSNIVMFVASSVGLDATVFDKPQIMISFDGWESLSYTRSVKRYNREDCLKSLTVLGGTKVVSSGEELIFWINKYLEDPGFDRENRKKIIDNHLHKIDGKAGERIANIILESI